MNEKERFETNEREKFISRITQQLRMLSTEITNRHFSVCLDENPEIINPNGMFVAADRETGVIAELLGNSIGGDILTKISKSDHLGLVNLDVRFVRGKYRYYSAQNDQYMPVDAAALVNILEAIHRLKIDWIPD